MCLSRAAELVEVTGTIGRVRFAGGFESESPAVPVDLRALPGASPGDWVLVHAGLAIERIDAGEAAALAELLAQLAAGPGATEPVPRQLP